MDIWLLSRYLAETEAMFFGALGFRETLTGNYCSRDQSVSWTTKESWFSTHQGQSFHSFFRTHPAFYLVGTSGIKQPGLVADHTTIQCRG